MSLVPVFVVALVLLVQPRETTSWQQGGNARKVSTTESALGAVKSRVTESRAPLHDADCAINLGSENTGSSSLTSIGVHSPGEISQYYSRDSNDKDTAPIADKDGLRRRLKERYAARRRKDFARVDDLDRILLVDFGVRVYDDPNVWTRQIHEPPIAYLRQRERKKLEKMKQLYGPAGHPYQRIGGLIDRITCSLSMTEIHALLSQVQLHRNEGRHEDADAALFELELHGVHICDMTKSWRADGRADFPIGEKPNRGYGGAPSYQLLEVSVASDLPATTRTRVEQLVSERAESLVREEDERALFLALELFCTYNVGVDDNSCSYSFQPLSDFSETAWSAPTLSSLMDGLTQAFDHTSVIPPLFLSSVGCRGDEQTRYSASARTRMLPSNLRRRVEDLVAERKIKMEENKMLEADAIKNELQATYGVVVDVKTQQVKPIRFDDQA